MLQTTRNRMATVTLGSISFIDVRACKYTRSPRVVPTYVDTWAALEVLPKSWIVPGGFSSG